MAVWGCKFDIFEGGGGRGVRIFQIWGGSEFSRTKFSRFVGRGGVFGSEFFRFGSSEVWVFKKPVQGRNTSQHWKVLAVASLIMMSSCIKLSRQHKLPLGAMKGRYVHFLCEKKRFLKITLLLLVNHDQFSSCKCRELQLYKADNKKLCGSLRETYQGPVCHNIFRFKCDEMSL